MHFGNIETSKRLQKTLEKLQQGPATTRDIVAFRRTGTDIKLKTKGGYSVSHGRECYLENVICLY